MLAGVRWALSFFLLVTLHVRALDETTGDEELAIDDAVMGEEYGLGDELKALADELGDGGTTDEGGGGADESEGLDDLKDYDPEERGFHDLEDYDSEEMMLYYGTDDDFYIPEDSADLRQFDSSELFTVQLAPKQSSCFYIDVEEASTLDVTGAYLVVENIPIEVKVYMEPGRKAEKERFKAGLPRYDTLYSDYAVEGNIRLEEPPSGPLKMCLVNAHHDERLKCQFAFRVGRSELATAAKKDDVFRIRNMVKQLQTRLNAISTEQTVLSMRIISHYELQVSNNSEVSVTALLESLVYIFVCIQQVYYITNLVETSTRTSNWA